MFKSSLMKIWELLETGTMKMKTKVWGKGEAGRITKMSKSYFHYAK